MSSNAITSLTFEFPDQIETLPINTERLKTIEDSIRQGCFVLHDAFDAQIWQKLGKAANGAKKEVPSFHNKNHLVAVASSAKLLLEASAQNNDILHLQKGLDSYNTDLATDEQIAFFELPFLVDMAVSMHDLGNIALPSETGQHGRFRPFYTAVGAEDSSKVFAEQIFNQVPGLSDIDKKRYTRFTQFLIDQTKFSVVGARSPENGLSVLMALCDQVGNDYFNVQEDRLLGLLVELGNEDLQRNGSTPVRANADTFINFAYYRTPAILSGLATAEKSVEALQHDLLTIWGKEAKKYQPLEIQDHQMSYHSMYVYMSKHNGHSQHA